MKENLQLEQLGVKGHVRIELYDAKTGELTDEQEGDNFIANFILTKALKQAQKALFVPQCYNNSAALPLLKSASSSTNNYDGMFRYLVLTNSTDDESPSTETGLSGNIIGYADRVPYVGADVLKGTINQVESYANEDKAHWVFDFGTDKANGTIGSVSWVYKYPETPATLNTPPLALGTNLEYVGTCKRAYAGNYITYGDGYYWARLGSTLYKIDPVTFEEIWTFTLKTTVGSNDIFFVVKDNYIYYYFNNEIIRQDLSSGTFISSTGQQGYVYENGTRYLGVSHVDENYIYVHGSSPSRNIRLLNFNTLALVKAFAPTSQWDATIALVVKNGIMYVACSSTYIPISWYILEFATGALTPIHNILVNEVRNITYKNNNLLFGYQVSFNVGGTSVNSNTIIGTFGSSVEGLKNYNLTARKRLDSPIVKTSAHTMKIIYEFQFS